MFTPLIIQGKKIIIMNKKQYMPPEIQIVVLQQQNIICGSPLNGVQTSGLNSLDDLSLDEEPKSGWGR